MSTCRIALADDHQLITSSLKQFLESHADCEVVLVAHNGQELVDKMVGVEVDLILIDIKMPVMDGVEALRIIKSRDPAQKVVVLSMYSDESLLLRLIKLRVNGYLSKSMAGEELLKAIMEVKTKGHYFNDELVKAMYNQTAEIEEENRDNALDQLDDTDLEILKLICEEMTSREIGEKLHLSARTVEGRRKRMLKHLNVKNQAGLVIYAVRNGVFEL